MTKKKATTWTDDDIEKLLILFAKDERERRTREPAKLFLDDLPDEAPMSPEDEAAADRFLAKYYAEQARQKLFGPTLARFRGYMTVEDFAERYGLTPVDVIALEAAELPFAARDEATARRAAELTEVQPLKILRVLRAFRAENAMRGASPSPVLLAARNPVPPTDDDG
jgi:hypothetical protein